MPKLKQAQKELIARSYVVGNTQSALATLYDVSRKTIQRVLIEYNLLPPMGMANKLKRQGYKLFTEDQQKILEICKEGQITSEKLIKMINTPILTGDNMVKTFAMLGDKEKVKFLTEARAIQTTLQEKHAKAS